MPAYRLLLVATLLAAGTASAQEIRTDAAAIARASADSVRRPYGAADIAFASGMIQHHAQAILMASWCATHGAGDELKTLCARIINAQNDEIHRMQQWLADRRQPITMPDTSRAMASMPAMMPGVLTAAGLDSLDRVRGVAFERLFLTDMIHHHQGAMAMVKQLFGTTGAGQDETIFKLATDINVDQATEISRMQRMLVSRVFGRSP